MMWRQSAALHRDVFVHSGWAHAERSSRRPDVSIVQFESFSDVLVDGLA